MFCFKLEVRKEEKIALVWINLVKAKKEGE